MIGPKRRIASTLRYFVLGPALLFEDIVTFTWSVIQLRPHEALWNILGVIMASNKHKNHPSPEHSIAYCVPQRSTGFVLVFVCETNGLEEANVLTLCSYLVLFALQMHICLALVLWMHLFTSKKRILQLRLPHEDNYCSNLFVLCAQYGKMWSGA